ncbi:histidinol phosphatase, partial [Burkholderia sp. Ac-20379]|nr:histidinol phosphatase [Burkholderia sp. Ac-20379]
MSELRIDGLSWTPGGAARAARALLRQVALD